MADRRRAQWFTAGAATCSAIVIAASAAVLTVRGVEAQTRASTPTPTLHSGITTIESGPVRRTVSGSVAVMTDAASIVSGAAGSSPGRRIVTREGAAPDIPLRAGDVIAVVNERPTFLLSSDVPFYREMAIGAVGRDIAALQSGLRALGYGTASDPKGQYGPGTARAVFFLYRDRSHQPIDATGSPVDRTSATSTVVPDGELLAAPNLPVQATTRCGQTGSIVDGTLCELHSSTGSLRMTVTAGEAETVRAGQPVSVALANGSELAASVGARVPKSSAELGASAAAGDDAPAASATGPGAGSASDGTSFALETADRVPFGATGTATVTVATTPDDSLRVVEIAIRSRGSERWLVARDGTKLPVSVGLCAHGVCSIKGPNIPAGRAIRLPDALTG